MKLETAHPGPERRRKGEPWLLLGSGLLALAPFAAHHRLFGRLFWFGDEFDLIDQMDRMGLWHWMWLVFAENFAPLFKLLWGGSVLAFQGSYFTMLVLLWLTHAVNVVLLGRVMRACAVPWAAVAAAQVLFGLTPVNIETLGWSVQWSAVLSTSFMLLALDGFLRAPLSRAPLAWVAASALSFSRGVLTGAVLALGCVWPGLGVRGGRAARMALAYLAPSIAVAALIGALAGGNHHHMGGHLGEAAVFGLWYYLLNPADRILGLGPPGWQAVAGLGALKLALVAWALARGTGRQRLLFALLVAADMGNAALLGIGRYHTGLPMAVSSRYQYASLIGIAPLLGFWVSRQLERIRLPGVVKAAVFSAALASVAVCMCVQWTAELEPFTRSRGADSRRILLTERNPAPHAVPGIPFMETAKAKALIDSYTLH